MATTQGPTPISEEQRDDYPVIEKSFTGDHIVNKGCDTPAPTIQSECVDLPQQSTMKVRVGRTDGSVVLDINGQIIHFNKEGALNIGKLIIDNALALNY